MGIKESVFGTLDSGAKAMLYTLENNGLSAQISNYGGVIYRLYAPDRDGRQADVVLGYPDFAGYTKSGPYLGALVGRNANRIANARLMIAGKECVLEQNEGTCNLHSGSGSLTWRLMEAEAVARDGAPALALTAVMQDGSDGFPGDLKVKVVYALTSDALEIEYHAVSDKDTVINLTNHSYFNLAGHSAGSIRGHVLQLSAPFFAPGDDKCLPTGEVKSVAGSPFDFQSPKAIGDGMDEKCEQLALYGGYDHNFVLAGAGYREVGKALEPKSGRTMRVFTTSPCVQFYSANMLADGTAGKDGAVYGTHTGFCLETQHFPNSPNLPYLRSSIYRAGETFIEKTAYVFGVE